MLHATCALLHSVGAGSEVGRVLAWMLKGVFPVYVALVIPTGHMSAEPQLPGINEDQGPDLPSAGMLSYFDFVIYT